jgi:hypothetical protein
MSECPDSPPIIPGCLCVIRDYVDWDGTVGLTVHPDRNCESETHT